MPRVLVNGVHIYYESHGEGFPLVFAYGLGGNTTEWASQIPAFSKQYRFIVWDPRGHGQSDSPPNLDQYGSGTSAYDLLELLNHLEIERAYVGGLSMGGGISTRFALLHPERVEALLIVDSASASGLPTSEANLRMRNRIVELALTEGMEAVADYAIKHKTNRTTWYLLRQKNLNPGLPFDAVLTPANDNNPLYQEGEGFLPGLVVEV